MHRLLLCALLAASMQLAFSCPDDCICFKSRGQKVADCAYENLDELPNQNGNVNLLDFMHNRLSKLTNGMFLNAGYANVSALNLRGNNISEIEPEAFKGLWNLTTLNLAFNKLTEVTKSTFDQLPKLQSLDLHGNPLTAITGSFQNPPPVKSLNLRDCRVRNVEDVLELNGPSWLDTLQTVDLESNIITCISDVALHRINRTDAFILRNNPLRKTCIPENLHDLAAITGVDVNTID